jgi:hypothetical protein
MLNSKILDIDLWLYYNLASTAMVQKDEESQLLYELIRLYEEIITELMRDHSEPLDSLKIQFQDLNELKTSLDIFKIDEKSNERMRRKIQLISLVDRIAQSTHDKDTTSSKMTDSPFLLPKKKVISKTTSKVATESKKQNIFSAGLAKLLGKQEKNHLKPIENIEKDVVKDITIPVDPYETEDIQSYNVNVEEQGPLEREIQEPINSTPSKSDKRSKEGIAAAENLVLETQKDTENERVGMPLVESQFSKSLMMLEKQVETLNSTNSRVANIDYLAEFKVRNQERVAKLCSETPNSDRTLSVSSTSLLHESPPSHMYFLLNNKRNQERNLNNASLHKKPVSPQKIQSIPKTESEKKVEQKRLKEAQKLDLYGSNRNAAIQQAYGIKIEGHSKIHPVLHKASRRNTTSVKHG